MDIYCDIDLKGHKIKNCPSTEPMAEYNGQSGTIENTVEAPCYVTNFPVNLLEITAESQTINGVTFTIDKAAGTITVDISSTGITENAVLSFTPSNLSNTNDTYFLSGCPAGGGWETTGYVLTIGAPGSTSYPYVTGDIGEGRIVTQTFENNRAYICIIKDYIAPNSHLVFRPCLIKGTQPRGFIPYGGGSVKTTGKNLFNINGNVNVEGSSSNPQVTKNIVENGILTANSNIATAFTVGQSVKTIPNKVYKMSFTLVSIGSGNHAVAAITDKLSTNRNTINANVINEKYTITRTATDDMMIFGFGTFNGTGAEFTDIMIEQVDDDVTEPSEYEPYQESSIFISPDTPTPVSGLKTFDGITNIFSDFDISLEYYVQNYVQYINSEIDRKVDKAISIVTKPYTSITAEIDQTDDNPETSVTRTINTIASPAATDKESVYNFIGHYPCLFKDGKEVVRLNPNDYSKSIYGDDVDITSGASGDVMVCFPRRGLTMSTDSNKKVTINLTDNPNDPNSAYNAHRRGSWQKDRFYLGAYKGWIGSDGKLRSLSGKTPTVNKTIGEFRTAAQLNGAGYEITGFYQLLYRQALYTAWSANLDSQTVVGRGFVDGNTAAHITGGTDAKGMIFGETTGKVQMKLFGLEDFYGNVWEWTDGMVTDANHNILTATDGFNDDGTGYRNNGQAAASNIGGWLSEIQGTTETGFLTKAVSGSESTYYCDRARVNASCVPLFGGSWADGSDAGAFHLHVYTPASAVDASVGSRLMFL